MLLSPRDGTHAIQVLWIEDIRSSSFTSKKWFVRRRSSGLGGATDGRDGSGSDSGSDDEQSNKTVSPLRFFKGARTSAVDPQHLHMLYDRLHAIAPSFVVNRVKFVATMRECLFDILGSAKARVQQLAAKQALRDARARPAGVGSGTFTVASATVDSRRRSLEAKLGKGKGEHRLRLGLCCSRVLLMPHRFLVGVATLFSY